MTTRPLHYYDAQGYYIPTGVVQPGATTTPPPEDVPEGKIARWSKALDDWEVVDIPAGGVGGSDTGLTDAQLRAAPVKVNTAYELYSAVTIMHALTDAVDGNAWVAFGAQACTGMDIINNTDKDIEYRRGGAGLSVKIKAGAARYVQGITNASQISVRRVDVTAGAVTVEAEAYTA